MSSTTVGPATGNGQNPTTGRGHGALERVTVNLTPRSSKALAAVVDLTGDSRTDAINRAIQVYAFMEEVLNSDGDVLVRRPGSDEMERLKIF